MADRSQVLLVGASDRVNGVQKLLLEFDLYAEGTIALKSNYNKWYQMSWFWRLAKECVSATGTFFFIGPSNIGSPRGGTIMH